MNEKTSIKCSCRKECPHNAEIRVTPFHNSIFMAIQSVTGTQEISLEKEGVERLEECMRRWLEVKVVE